LVAVSVSSWRCSGVLAGMGTGTNTSTYNITGFGTGDVVLGATSPPGARLFNTLWQEFCEFRLRPTSGAELVRVGVGRGGDGDGEGRGGEGRGGEGRVCGLCCGCSLRLCTQRPLTARVSQEWQRGCMGNSTTSRLCGLDSVLIRAWCTRQYQVSALIDVLCITVRCSTQCCCVVADYRRDLMRSRCE
jgi:hypothetical protein